MPDIVWWILPVGAIALIVARWRPAPWTWPIIAAVLVYPPTWSNVWSGNTMMWVAAAFAGGLAFGWPGPFLLLKPSVAPPALAGIWRREWWIGLAVLLVLSAPFLGQWIDYVTVVRLANVPAGYGVPGLPIYLGLTLAYLGRKSDRPPRATRRNDDLDIALTRGFRLIGGDPAAAPDG